MTSTAYRSQGPAGADGFAQLVRAEWTKFRTVRGWVVGLIVAGLLVVGVGLLGHSECGSQVGAVVTTGGPGCGSPLGPGGEAVTDSFYFVHQSLAPAGRITVRVTSMTGPEPWSKAGIIIKANTVPGSAYAAMMVTGRHGVRMQWDYTQDAPGLAGAVSAASPRWLRLIRSGDTITGYDSADGTHWARVGTATLAGLPPVVPAGLFAASPDSSGVTSQSIGGGSGSGGTTTAAAGFDQVAVAGVPLAISEPMMRARGIFIDPVPALTELRLLAGTAALLAVTAVLAVAVGAVLRRGAAAVTAVFAVTVLPYFFASPLAVLPAGAADWLLRVTPAAAFAIQQPYPRYPQVAGDYTPGYGYYPLAPWAGFTVLCAWTALALGVAAHLLRRRDA